MVEPAWGATTSGPKSKYIGLECQDHVSDRRSSGAGIKKSECRDQSTRMIELIEEAAMSKVKSGDAGSGHWDGGTDGGSDGAEIGKLIH